jgi:hypothetical protein
LFVSPTNVVGQTTAPRLVASGDPVCLVVRSDDGGMSHSAVPTLVDYHMGTVSRRPEFREIAQRLACEHGLGISNDFGERRDNPRYAAAPLSNLLVTHAGIEDAELGALIDKNVDGGLPEMSRNRQGELDALASGRFATRSGRATSSSFRIGS